MEIQNPQQSFQQQHQEPAQQPVQPQATQYQQPGQTQYAQPQYQQYAPQPATPFSKGWQDIKSTPEYIKSLGFKGIVNCVPILNWCLYGSSGNWGNELVNGQKSPMPKKMINEQNFKDGFFYFLIALILSLILSFVALVPLIGSLVMLVAMFFLPAAAGLMFYRYLAYRSFGEAFGLKDIWSKANRKMGQLWTASFLPELITGLIGGAIATVIIVIGCLAAGVSIADLSYYGSRTSSTYAMTQLVAMMGSISLAVLLASIVAAFCGALGIVWSLRSVGYWVADYAPEWNASAAQQERAARMAAQAQMYQAQQQQYQYGQPYQQQQQYQQYQPYQQAPQHPQYQPQVQPQHPQYQPQAQQPAQPVQQQTQPQGTTVENPIQNL